MKCSKWVSKMTSKRVSKIYFRETRIQNLFEKSIQGECPNDYPKCVPGRYVFWGRALQNAFWVTRELPQGIRWRCAETWSPSYRKCDKQKSGLSKCMQGKRTVFLSASRCLFEIWVWSGGGVCAGCTRAYPKGIRRGIRRVSATLVKSCFSLT